MHGENGVLCRPDAQDLLGKIEYAMALDDKTKAGIERNAKKRIEMLRPEISVKKLVHFYQAVIRMS